MTTTTGSTIIDAPIDQIWSVLRDFGALTSWFSGAAFCTLEDGKRGDQVGVIRLVTPAGTSMTVPERLTSLSDEDHVFTYLVECEGDYGTAKAAPGGKARVELRKITHGSGTFVTWSHDSEVVEGDPAVLHDFYRGVYGLFFQDLAKAVAKQ